MRLTFAGAGELVTGSCLHVEAGGREALVDCGACVEACPFDAVVVRPGRKG